MECPHCHMKMLNAVSYFNSELVQEINFCRKCKYKILGKIVKGYLEVENLYFVEIEFESTGAEVEKIAKIRKLDKSTSIPELKTKLLNSKNIRLGTYSTEQAEYIYQKAISLELNAKIMVAEVIDNYLVL